MNENSEIRYVATALRRLEDVARLIARYFSSTHSTPDILEELSGQIQDKLDENTRLLTLVLAAIEKQKPGTTGPLSGDAFKKRRHDLRELLVTYYDKLGQLELRAAAQGPWPPIETTSAIEAQRKQIKAAEEELEYFEKL